jgi:hypothetical protein
VFDITKISIQPDTGGMNQVVQVNPAQSPVLSGDSDSTISTLDLFDMIGSTVERDSQNDPIVDTYNIMQPQVFGGCPSCGCGNLP